MKKKLIAVNKLCLGVPEGEVCIFTYKILLNEGYLLFKNMIVFYLFLSFINIYL